MIAKTYNFTVLVHVFDFNKEIQTIELRVQGKGFSGNKPLVKAINRPTIGQRSNFSDVGTKVFFSIEDIDFEEMQP